MMRRAHTSLGCLALWLVMLAPAAGWAQQEQACEGPEGVERKERSSLIGERTFRRLSAVHEQLGESQYADALKGLKGLESGNLNDYESAMVNQTYGYVYAAQGKYDHLFFQVACHK